MAQTQPAGPAPTYAELAAAHNARVQQLQSLHGVGVLEIRWIDDKGKRHTDQGDMELWINLPDRTSLRLDKVGEMLLWIGSDERRWWVFDFLSKEKVLRVGQHDEAVQPEGQAQLAVKPRAMLDLMGLTPLPAALTEEPQVEYDKARNAWIITATVDSRMIRLYFSAATLLPIRIESLNPQGQTALFSELQRYDSVQSKGMNPVAFPKMAKLIDITHGSPDTREPAQVKIAVNEYTDGVIDAQPFDRVFDLERLRQRYQPQRVEGELQSPP